MSQEKPTAVRVAAILAVILKERSKELGGVNYHAFITDKEFVELTNSKSSRRVSSRLVSQIQQELNHMDCRLVPLSNGRWGLEQVPVPVNWPRLPELAKRIDRFSSMTESEIVGLLDS